MKRIFLALASAWWLLTGVPCVSAMDVYDWRAGTEGLCADSFKVLDRPIQTAMAGGRPERLVVEKLKESVPNVMGIGEVDETAARIIIKSMVHSFFSDTKLRNPLNFSVDSFRKVYRDCSAAVLKYDPDGRKTGAYRKMQQDAYKKQRAREDAERAAAARIEQAEEEARREEQEKVEKEAREREKQRAADEQALNESRRKLEEAAREEERRALSERMAAEAAEKEKLHQSEVNSILKNVRTDEDIAKEEAKRKQDEEEARKANSGIGGFIKSLL